MRSPRAWWAIFGLCALAVVGVLAWISVDMQALERGERAARVEASHRESVQLALWRMDSWLGPHIAREAARQFDDYDEGAPRLAFDSSFIRVHFQAWPDGRLTAAPEADAVPVPAGLAAPGDDALALVARLIGRDELAKCVAAGETSVNMLAAQTVDLPVDAVAATPDARSQQELVRRQVSSALNAGAMPEDRRLRVGPLVPVWADAAVPTALPELMFVRRAVREGAEVLQGFLLDWPQLRAALLAEVADLLPGATLVPVATVDPGPAALSGHRLASIPARLEVTPPAGPGLGGMTPARTTLAVMWLAVVLALVAAGVTLHASIAFGERRSRFASAVTHELRTPLTTFRMYTEMLAEGMVTDEGQRQAYLRTLQDESDRLGALVENVLAYARLERGGPALGRVKITLGALVEHVRAALERRAERASMALEIEVRGAADVPVCTNVEAVSQILLNLVENACKYAAGGEDSSVRIEARVEDSRLRIDVCDHGPGIDAEHARAVFLPFDRGGRGADDPSPGVGLGLALSRGLARRLGGDLRLRDGSGEGAAFRLDLPAA